MANYTTWRVGGTADQFFVPLDRQELQDFLADLPADVPVTWLGLGSNLLVRDGGIRGVVISTHRGLRALQLVAADRVYAEAGVTMARLARFAGQHHLSGVEFAGGIPGTIGGALTMNAGAFGQETWDVVEAVELISRQGEVSRLDADAFEIGYRHVELADDLWFVGACFKLQSGKGDQVNTEVRNLISARNQSQPVGTANAGSVFRNPPGDYAARLLQAAGMKSVRIGGAHFSKKHANFIINDEQATAADIEALIQLAQKTVFKKFAIQLQPEVRIVGEVNS